MAVQIPDPGTGNGQTGDNEYVFRKKVKDNFSDQTNAASRLVGTAAGNVMQVSAFGIGGMQSSIPDAFNKLPLGDLRRGQIINFSDVPQVPSGGCALILSCVDTFTGHYLIGSNNGSLHHAYCVGQQLSARVINYAKVLTGHNTTQDPNGFLKGASPVAEIYSDKMDLNEDAEQQGGITFEKLGTGDYLIKGSLGFAQEGWYIETPKDANGNVLVAVVYEQLANNDISIKTYAKRFDDETGDIVASLLKPRDIPTGRFISLRLHELPKEPPIMPTETQPEV